MELSETKPICDLTLGLARVAACIPDKVFTDGVFGGKYLVLAGANVAAEGGTGRGL